MVKDDGTNTEGPAEEFRQGKRRVAVVGPGFDMGSGTAISKVCLDEIIDSSMDRFRQSISTPDLKTFKAYSLKTRKVQRQIYRELEGQYSANPIIKWSQRAVSEFLAILKRKSEPLNRLYSVQKENLGGAHYVLSSIYDGLEGCDLNAEDFCSMGNRALDRLLKESRLSVEDLKSCRENLSKVEAHLDSLKPDTEGYYAVRDKDWRLRNRMRRTDSVIRLCEQNFFMIDRVASQGHRMGNSIGVSAELIGLLRDRYLIAYNVLHKLLPTITYTQRLASQGKDAFELSAVMNQTLNQAFYLEDKHLPAPRLLSEGEYIDADYEVH
jgi:hypothetical protein